MSLALGVLGVLTRRILEEAIGAEDLNKVHLMEASIASNATLQGSFDQIERLAYRLLDWGDFRVYRVDGTGPTLAYRGTLGRPGRGEPPAGARACREAIAADSRWWSRTCGATRASRRRCRAWEVSWSTRSDSARSCSARSRSIIPSATPTAPRTSWRYHARQSDGHGDPHRRAAPAAAQHGRPDRPAGDRAGPRDRLAPRLGARPGRRLARHAAGRGELESFVTGGLRATDSSPPPRGPWRRRARRPPQASGTAAEVAARTAS